MATLTGTFDLAKLIITCDNPELAAQGGEFLRIVGRGLSTYHRKVTGSL